jgi:glycosyltransferase involved in cell wall biosynthesis
MKIVYLGNYVQDEKLSGPEKVAKRLFNEANAEKIDCVFLEYFFKEYSDSNIFRRIFAYKIISNSPLIIRAGIIPCILFLKKFRPDIIHIVTFKRYVITPLYLRSFLHSKIVTTLHGIYKFEKNYFRKQNTRFGIIKDTILEKLIFSKSDLIVFLSEQQKSIASKYYKINERKTTVIPNGIDTNYANKRGNLNNSKQLKIIFYNGFSHEVKGLELFLKVLSKLRDKSLDFELYLLGNKPSQEINNILKVHYVNFMSNTELAEFFGDKDVYANTSFYEPFSLFAVEAMAAGIIVIVSNHVGMNQFINNRENGFIFDYNNQSQLEEILESVLSKKIDLNAVSQNAKLIYEQLNWKVVLNLYLKVYNNLLLNGPTINE